MTGSVCPYCSETFQAGDHLWQVFVVSQPPSPIIMTPGVPSGTAGSMQLDAGFAHASCAYSVAPGIGGRGLYVKKDEDTGRVTTHWDAEEIA